MKLSKRIRISACVAAVAGLLAGCVSPAAGKDENLLGLKGFNHEKQMIIITCNAELKHFSEAVEERFPDILLVQDSYKGQYRNSEMWPL